MAEVGSLKVTLSANAAEFVGDMGKSSDAVEDLGNKSKDASDKIGKGMYEARSSLMLVEDSVGVRLPRALNTLISRIPGVGEAFGAMLPIAGVAVAIEVVGKLIGGLIEKQEALAKAQHAAAQAATDQAVKEADQTEALELTNLKLDDQIARLEHKPAHNYMAEAILETAMEMDKLAAGFAADFAKMDDTISEQLQVWGNFKTVMEQTFGAGSWDITQLTATLASSTGHMLQQRAALNELQTAMSDVSEKRREMAEAGGDDGTQGAMLASLKGQLAALDRVIPEYAGNTEMLLKFKTMAASTAHEIHDLGIEMENAAKQKIIAGQEQAIANLEPLKEAAANYQKIAADAEKAAEAERKMNDDAAKTTLDKTQGNGDPAQKYAAQHEFNERTLEDASELADKLKEIAFGVYYKEYAANVDNTNKQEQLTQAYYSKIDELSRQSNAALGEFNAKDTAEYAAMVAEKLKLTEQANKQMVAIAIGATKEEETANLEGLKTGEAANNAAHAQGLETERQYVQNKIALSELEFAEKRKSLNAQIELENAAADMANESGDSKGESEAIEKANQLRAQRNTLDSQFRAELIQQEGEAQKLTNSWKSYFTEMKNNTQDLSTTIKGTLQKSITQFEDQFANSMAKCIVEGKNLGQAVRQESEQMAEAMISAVVKWLEQWIITHAMALISGKATTQAQIATASGLAGANMVASWAAAPFPLDALAPAMGSEAAAAAMAFSAETGGKIPGEGPVPLLAHGGESVVQKVLTDRVEAAERSGGSGGGDMHMHYSPTVHAMDAEGVDRVLAKHGSTFERNARSMARKKNK